MRAWVVVHRNGILENIVVRKLLGIQAVHLSEVSQLQHILKCLIVTSEKSLIILFITGVFLLLLCVFDSFSVKDFVALEPLIESVIAQHIKISLQVVDLLRGLFRVRSVVFSFKRILISSQ